MDWLNSLHEGWQLLITSGVVFLVSAIIVWLVIKFMDRGMRGYGEMMSLDAEWQRDFQRLKDCESPEERREIEARLDNIDDKIINM